MKKYILFLIIAFSALWFLSSATAQAADHYINAACSSACDGSTWAKGWATFGAVTWTRGNTYYVAGGIYNGNVTIAAAESGSTWITVKKANASDNGGDAGWNSSFATTQAVINGALSIDNGYISIDGVTGTGTSGHGIKVHSTATSGSVVTLEFGISFVNLYHIDIRGAGYAAATDYRGVMLNSSGSKGIHFRYLYVHEATTNGYTLGGIVGTSFSDYGLLFEDNYQEETGGCTNPDLHGQGIQVGYGNTQNYWIIRNSVIKNALGSAYIAFLGYGDSDNIYIYNNIFWSTDRNKYIDSPGVIWAHELASMDNLRIYNNTFYNISLSRIAIDASGSTRELKNNLFHTGYFNYTHTGVTSQYNAYYNCTGGGTYPYGVPVGETGQQNEASSPIISSSNFALVPGAKSIDSGTNLSAYFTTDYLDNSRPFGSAWDIGAYEYTGSTPPPSTYTLSISKSGIGSGTVSGGSINCGSTCTTTVAAGTQIILTAFPDSGSTFDNWSGACSGAATTCSLTLNANTSVGAAFNTALPSSCSFSSTAWQSKSITTQSGSFRLDFDTTPSSSSLDDVTGVSFAPATGYTDLAAIIRFNNASFIDVMNGTAYMSIVPTTYTPGTSYHVRLDINIPGHTYSAYVTPQGGSQVALADNYAFRNTQSSVTSLSYVDYYSDPTSSGTHTLCNLSVSNDTTPPAAPTGVTVN